jgi:uncharacterized protein (TIRG00374 family)
LKKHLILAVKILVSLALLAYIFAQLDWTALIDKAGTIAWWGLPLATAALLAALYTSTIRWTILLRTHHPEYRINTLFRPYLIAALFSNVMPSSTGGDLIRSYYIYRYSRDAVSAISPVISERVIGLVILIALNVMAIYFTDSIGIVHAGVWSTLLIVLGVSLAALTLIAIPATYWPLHRLLEKLSRFRIVQVLLRIGESTHGYLTRPGIVIAQVVFSLAGQFLAIMVYQILALALDIHISFEALLVVVPLAFIMASLPISIGGMGVRELTAVALFTRFGIGDTDAAAVALFFIPVVILASLPGLYFYLTSTDSKELMQGASSGKLG